MSKFNINPIQIVRAFQALLAVLVIGLLGHVAQWFNTNILSASGSTNNVPNEIAFAIFVSVFTILITLPYVTLVPRYFPHIFTNSTKHTILALEALSMILYFASFVAVAAFLGKLSVCRGDVCTAAKVGTVFAAIAWVMWAVTSLFALRFVLGVGAGNGSANVNGNGSGGKGDGLFNGLRLHRGWAGRGAVV